MFNSFVDPIGKKYLFLLTVVFNYFFDSKYGVMNWFHQSTGSGNHLGAICDKANWFFNVGPPKKSIFLTTIYGLYFSHHYTDITKYSLSHILQICMPIHHTHILLTYSKMSDSKHAQLKPPENVFNPIWNNFSFFFGSPFHFSLRPHFFTRDPNIKVWVIQPRISMSNRENLAAARFKLMSSWSKVFHLRS